MSHVSTRKLEKLAGVRSETQRWRAFFPCDNLNVLPRDAGTPTSFERLHRGFFCGEARRVALSGYRLRHLAVGAFSGRENALAETGSSQQNFADAMNFDDVYAC